MVDVVLLSRTGLLEGVAAKTAVVPVEGGGEAPSAWPVGGAGVVNRREAASRSTSPLRGVSSSAVDGLRPPALHLRALCTGVRLPLHPPEPFPVHHEAPNRGGGKDQFERGTAEGASCFRRKGVHTRVARCPPFPRRRGVRRRSDEQASFGRSRCALQYRWRRGSGSNGRGTTGGWRGGSRNGRRRGAFGSCRRASRSYRRRRRRRFVRGSTTGRPDSPQSSLRCPHLGRRSFGCRHGGCREVGGGSRRRAPAGAPTRALRACFRRGLQCGCRGALASRRP